MQIGCHVALTSAVTDALAVGAEVAQVTLGDPQSWKKPTAPTGLADAARDAGIGLYVHSAYVINVASTNNRIRVPSRRLLQQTIDAAADLGARGVIVHGGHVTKDDAPEAGYENWRKCVDGLEIKVPLLIENTAGGNNAMMRYLEAIRATWSALAGSDNLEHVGFCLDTCHAHAAGLDLATAVDDIRSTTGRIDLVHCNDSADSPGSGRDRHANWGQGIIDKRVLLDLLRAADADVILETPSAAHGDEIAWLRNELSS